MAVSKNEPKKSLGRRIKETFGELKKVNWPGFLKVVRATGIVLAVVAVFTVVLFGIDYLLSWLHTVLLK